MCRPCGEHRSPPFFLLGLDTGRPMFRATARVAPTAENGPGAFARQGQAQLWNRSSSNFCKPRAQWPGRNCGQSLRFCAPEIICLAEGLTPVMGSGESGPMDLGGAKRSRSPSAAPPGDPLVTFPAGGLSSEVQRFVEKEFKRRFPAQAFAGATI